MSNNVVRPKFSSGPHHMGVVQHKAHEQWRKYFEKMESLKGRYPEYLKQYFRGIFFGTFTHAGAGLFGGMIVAGYTSYNDMTLGADVMEYVFSMQLHDKSSPYWDNNHAKFLIDSRILGVTGCAVGGVVGFIRSLAPEAMMRAMNQFDAKLDRLRGSK